MRKSNVVAFVLSSLAVGLIVACGSDPKPDPNVATTPTATPSTTDMPNPAGAVTTATGDAGGGDASATADAGPTQEQQCDALQAEAQSEMDAERIKVDKACKKDADCMPIKGRACQFICTNGAIPKAEEKEWQRELAAVNDGPCKKWNDLGCKKADAKPPTCSDDKKKPACDKGHCILK